MLKIRQHVFALKIGERRDVKAELFILIQYLVAEIHKRLRGAFHPIFNDLHDQDEETIERFEKMKTRMRRLVGE
jgi:hypothetical protein